MTFHLPAQSTQAPITPERDVRSIPLNASVVATYGAAKDLSRLTSFPKLRDLWLSGLPEKHVPLISSLGQLSSLVVHDLRCTSLLPFAGLGHLERLVICGTSRLQSLEGLGSLVHLRELLLVLVTGIRDLEPLTSAPPITTLCIEGGFSKALRLPTLGPLAAVSTLTRLRLASLRVADGSLRPLHRLSAIRDLFIADVFSPQEFRALAHALPNASGEWLDSYRHTAV
ncbi:hypothetical protein EG835_02375 [bacterium]|nr:hypothetical protein [bacterium]